jgi:hypothetical protein
MVQTSAKMGYPSVVLRSDVGHRPVFMSNEDITCFAERTILLPGLSIC